MEATVALGLLGIFVMACLSSIVTNQICDQKAKQESIAMDFLTKYVENIKALPFTSIGPGLPINSIYNGSSGSPLIAIPANTNWIPVNTSAYEIFYPDLVWVTNLNPKMQVIMTMNSNNNALHDVQINTKLSWSSSLAKGGTLQVQVDLLRTVDAPAL